MKGPMRTPAVTSCAVVLFAAILFLGGLFWLGVLAPAPTKTENLAGGEALPSCSPFVVEGVKELDMTPKPFLHGQIFVSVASYRDTACSSTVKGLFDMAANPDLVRVGIVQQNDPVVRAEDCFNKCEACRSRLASGNIIVKTFDFLDAKGPAYARFLASSLWQGEEFYLQVDSHTKFERGWDITLINEWRNLRDPKAVLGMYPPTAEQMVEFRKTGGAIKNCKLNFSPADYIPIIGSKVVDKKDAKSTPQKYLGAGFIFFPGTMLYDVPYDPYLVFLFFAEEFLFSLRLWTNGYNLYSIEKPMATHDYSENPSRPRFWKDSKLLAGCKDKAMSRAEFFLGLREWKDVDKDFQVGEKYGAGKVRTVAQYYDFIGLNLAEKKAADTCNSPVPVKK